MCKWRTDLRTKLSVIVRRLYSILMLFISLIIYSQDTTTTFDGLLNKGILKDGKKQGTWTSHDDKGRIRAKSNYVNGVLDGHSIGWTYQLNDTTINEGDYKNGEPTGKWTLRHTDKYLSTFSTTIEYSANKKIKSTFYQNNYVAREYYYMDKTPIGTWTLYYPSGAKYRDIPYKNGAIDGKVTTWYLNGKIKSEVLYINGVQKEKKCWDDKGNLDKSCKDSSFASLFPFDS